MTNDNTDTTVVTSTSEQVQTTPYQKQEINIKSLIEAGSHYGHQSDRWNPKMLPYIYGERNGVHIINLDKTVDHWKRAKDFLYKVISNGGTLLMVGTKQQAREIVKENCTRCGCFSVTTRWLGGTLTNFQTLKNSVDRMKKLEQFLVQSQDETSGIKISKKERVYVSKSLEKLVANLGGIRDMKRAPDVIFVIDTRKEHIAISEAKKLGIPVVALVDSNVDPTMIDYPIPANDDSSRSITIFTQNVADIFIDARRAYEKSGRKSEYGETDNNRQSRPRGPKRDGNNNRGGNKRGKDRNNTTEKPSEAPEVVMKGDVIESSPS